MRVAEVLRSEDDDMRSEEKKSTDAGEPGSEELQFEVAVTEVWRKVTMLVGIDGEARCGFRR